MICKNNANKEFELGGGGRGGKYKVLHSKLSKTKKKNRKYDSQYIFTLKILTFPSVWSNTDFHKNITKIIGDNPLHSNVVNISN